MNLGQQYDSVIAFNERSLQAAGIQLDEEQVIEVMSSWVMKSVITLLKKMPRFEAKTLASILGVSREESQRALESLARMQLLKEQADGSFLGAPLDLCFDEDFINTSDQLAIHKKAIEKTESTIGSKDIFGSYYVLSNRQTVQRLLPRIMELINELNAEQLDPQSKDVIAFDYSFVKISKGGGI